MLDRASSQRRLPMLRLISLVLLVGALACEQGDGVESRVRPGGDRDAIRSCDDTRLVRHMRRGFVRGRSPDVLLVPREPNYIGAATRPVHTGPWDYLVRVPLVFYGPGVVEGRAPVQRAATVADIAP